MRNDDKYEHFTKGFEKTDSWEGYQERSALRLKSMTQGESRNGLKQIFAAVIKL